MARARTKWPAMAATVVALVTGAERAHACPEAVDAWAARCARAAGVALVPQVCERGRIVVAAAVPGAPAQGLELHADAARAFRRVGTIGLDPIGSFRDWSHEPAWRRDALDRAVECVARIGPPPLASVPGTFGPPPHVARAPLLLACGLALCLLAIGWRLRALSLGRRTWLGLAALTLVGVACRCVLVPAAPFHQNGQGPLWVGSSLGLPTLAPIYGPGFAETFGWLALGDPANADVRIATLQTILLGACIPCVWLLGRLSGGRGAMPWVFAAGFALHPLVARLSRSESYYGLALGLFVFAGTGVASALAAATRRLDREWLVAAAGLCGGGCLVAQAARVHPVSWLAAATLPLVAAMIPGTMAAVAVRALGSAAAIGSVVAVTSLPAMLAVVEGELGRKWLPRSGFHAPGVLELALTAALFALSRRRLRDLVAPVCFGLCLYLALRTNPVLGGAPRVVRAYHWLYLPAALACLAGSLRGVRPPRVRFAAAALLALGLLGVELPELRGDLTLATDVREATAMAAWRSALPRGSTVVYLARADERLVALPLFDPEAVASIAVKTSEDPPALPEPTGLFYFRTSLCSTPEGRDPCRRLEARLELAPLHEAALPPEPSNPWQPLGPEPIPVGLFRVDGVRPDELP